VRRFLHYLPLLLGYGFGRALTVMVTAGTLFAVGLSSSYAVLGLPDTPPSSPKAALAAALAPPAVGEYVTPDFPAVAETRAGGPLAEYAVLRISSHGCSATVITTAPGRSLLLGCAHAFQGNSRSKPLTLDLPSPRPGPPQRLGVRLIAVDGGLDLSLIELTDGPLPYVAPVAPAGWRPAPECLSVGYDGMKLPPQRRPAHLLGSDGRTTYTRERPWHGRSGGALLDAETGFLIGVVQGYETSGQQRGMYVAHSRILQFLGQPGAAPPPGQMPAPPGRDLRPGPWRPPGY
jgi:hypothetical protein